MKKFLVTLFCCVCLILMAGTPEPTGATKDALPKLEEPVDKKANGCIRNIYEQQNEILDNLHEIKDALKNKDKS